MAKNAEAPQTCRKCAANAYCEELRLLTKRIAETARGGDSKKADELMQSLKWNGHRANIQALTAHAEAMANMEDSKQATEILREMKQKEGMEPDAVAIERVCLRLIKRHGAEVALECVHKLSRAMEKKPRVTRRVTEEVASRCGGEERLVLKLLKMQNGIGKKSLGHMLQQAVEALCKKGDTKAARGVMEGMHSSSFSLASPLSIHPLLRNYLPIFESLAQEGNLREARELLEKMKWHGVQPNQRVFNLCLKSAKRSNNLSACVALLRELDGGGSYDVSKLNISPDLVSMTTVMDCAAANGLPGEVDRYMQSMRARGITADERARALAIKAHAFNGNAEAAREAFEKLWATLNGKASVPTWNYLVTAHAFELKPESCLSVVDEMRKRGQVEPDERTLRTLIFAYGRSGRAREFVHAIRLAVEVGIDPSSQGMRDAVIDACHAGNLDASVADQQIRRVEREKRGGGVAASALGSTRRRSNQRILGWLPRRALRPPRVALGRIRNFPAAVAR